MTTGMILCIMMGGSMSGMSSIQFKMVCIRWEKPIFMHSTLSLRRFPNSSNVRLIDEVAV